MSRDLHQVVDTAGTGTLELVKEFPVPPPTGGSTNDPLVGIRFGPDGKLWFTEYVGGTIDKLGPTTGAITQYPVQTGDSAATGSSAADQIGEAVVEQSAGPSATPSALASSRRAIPFTATITVPNPATGTPQGTAPYNDTRAPLGAVALPHELPTAVVTPAKALSAGHAHVNIAVPTDPSDTAFTASLSAEA